MSQAVPADGIPEKRGFGGMRLIAGYLLVGAILAAAIVISVSIGHGLNAPPELAGTYSGASSTCLGKEFTFAQSGRYLTIDGSGSVGGKLHYSDGRITGDVTCVDGATAAVDVAVTKEGTHLSGSVGSESITATRPATAEEAAAKPTKKRSSEETFGRLMLAIAAVLIAARICGETLARLAQPRVMGEVIGGILLGPTLLGAIWPEAQGYLFPVDIVPLLSAAAQIGLAFYLFLVGMEVDVRLLRERIANAAFISNTSVAFPLALGFLVALPTYEALSPHVRYLPFALFMGVSMSITAFPVLARILVERRMLKKPVGALALAGAAIDDVTAWCLLALATAVASTGNYTHALVVVALISAFAAAILLVGRPLLARVSRAYDEVGTVPALWLAVIYVAVLLSAYLSQQIGVAAIFGAFIVGLIMPRHAGLTRDVNRRTEDFVTFVLLPLFFVVTGLKTKVTSLDRPSLWLFALALFAVAVVGKWVGATLAARYSGMTWRDSNALGALMNTRGLTELIVLNIGLDLGIISQALFTMLVLMALATTFMAGPALRWLDPKRELSSDPEEDLRAETAPVPGTAARAHSILVAPQDDRKVDALLAVAEPLAQSQPPRELILARLLEPADLAAGLGSEERHLQRATDQLNERRELLLERGIATRAVAFTSPDIGADLVGLASQQDVDLLLLNGRRPLVGEAVPRGPVATLLDGAPCDLAILVESEDMPTIDADHPVVVPFGGAEHDWAALELGAWIASVRGAPLHLLGAAGANGDGRDASKLLADASLVVQQLAGIPSEPVLASPGREMIEAAKGAGLFVVGLSERWRTEGLGELRGEIARSGVAPTLFVRRGERAGALAPRDNMTQFRWSSAGPPARR
jgi:Kef-type K+ transport system membrane component KefB